MQRPFQHGESMPASGADIEASPSWASLPPSPSNGDLAKYDPGAGGTFLLRYDAGEAAWMCTSTFGVEAVVPLVVDGAVNADLLTISTTGAPAVSVASSGIVVAHDTATTKQEWKAALPFLLVGGCTMYLDVDTAGYVQPGAGFLNAAVQLGSGDVPDQDGYQSKIFQSASRSYPEYVLQEHDAGGAFVADVITPKGLTAGETHEVRAFGAEVYAPGSGHTTHVGGGCIEHDNTTHEALFDSSETRAGRTLTPLLYTISDASYDATASVKVSNLRIRI